MIDFLNVEKTYKSGVEALRGVSFSIEDGEFVFIIGKSGSGKSTLLKCITCEERPTSGKVLIDNFDISRMSRALVPALRRKIGMIYQDFRLIETKTVAENVAFAGEIIGVPKQSLMNTVQICLSVVGLKDKADCYPQELSGGEQQRVAIARAMVNNPSLIVADEPTGNLDPETSEAIMAMLLEINRNGGTTVIICTHDSAMVDRMKQRVIEIDDGLIARDEKKSGYRGEVADHEAYKPQNAKAPGYESSNSSVAFGDDEEYNDGYDDPGYGPAVVSPVKSVVFGEDSSGVHTYAPVEPANIPEEAFFIAEEKPDFAKEEPVEEITDLPEEIFTTEEAVEVKEEEKTEVTEEAESPAQEPVTVEEESVEEPLEARVTELKTTIDESFVAFGDEKPAPAQAVPEKTQEIKPADPDLDPDITSDEDAGLPEEDPDVSKELKREQKRKEREEKLAQKEAKRKEKLDKKKKVRRTDFQPGSDIDLFPEDEE
ncbi:MAG: cell division ATP-binding protein FtsE [Clostridiales bacterium]|nr:cell division ATP-binding protein FtsE [Clostridiales bacterium]